MNAIKDSIKSGRTVIGTTVTPNVDVSILADAGYDFLKNYRDYLDTVNDGLVIVPMIETNQSLENLDAIASVPGVDVLLIGPSDLSIELGGATRLPVRHLSASA